MAALDSDDAIPGNAENEVTKVLSAQPDYVPALMAKGAIRLQKGDTAEASAIYRSILQKWPDFAPAQKRLASIYANEPANAGKAYELASKARRTLVDDPALTKSLMPQGYKARPEQVILFKIAAWDTNCPQHIPQKFDAADVAAALAQRDALIAELEAELAALKGEPAASH